jgi:hypothetical protein
MSRRPGVLYEFWGYDPYVLLKGKLKVVCLYVGQTRQRPETRRDQHLHGGLGNRAKVWADLVTEWKVVYRRRKVAQWWLDFREAWRIAAKHPQNNVMLNMVNPKRIPPWEQKHLRKIRDERGGAAVLIARAQGQHRIFARIYRDSGQWKEWTA